MTRTDIFDAFMKLFPTWAPHVESYKKIGSKTISLQFKNGKSRVFLYNDDDNWNFGTKLWRKKPKPIPKKKKEKKVRKC